MREGGLLAVEGLCAWYGGAQILFDVALTVGRGEVVALMGRNGAGKSTTMKSIMGLVGRTRGSVRLPKVGQLRIDVAASIPRRENPLQCDEIGHREDRSGCDLIWMNVRPFPEH